MQHLILIACLVQAALSAPQDGKVGVNFLGYHAEAGLGGGQQDGQGLLGGLHASAGTPWGQNAAAGLGGNVNGRSSGLLYAGAEATPDVGASTVLGGDTAVGGFRGAEAHANGRVQSKMHNLLMSPQPPLPPLTVADNDASAIQKIPHTTNNDNNNNNNNKAHNFDESIDKLNNAPSPAADDSVSIVRQRSKYHQRQHHQHPKRRRQREKIRSKTIYKAAEKPQKILLPITSASVSSEIHPQLIQYPQQQQQQQQQQQETQKELIVQKHSSRRALVADHATSDRVNVNVVKAKPTGKNVQVAYDAYTTGDVVRQSLQIPIGILQSLQESLAGLRGRKIITVHQEVTKP